MAISPDYADVKPIDHDPGRYDTISMDWTARQRLYAGYWKYWSGAVFDEVDEHAVTPSGKKPQLYPLELNLVEMACMLHASGLVGDTSNRDTPLEVSAKPRKDRGGKEVADHASTVLSDFYEMSGLESIIDEQALQTMVFGGSVWATRFEPEAEMKVRLEKIWPEFFFPVCHPGDMDRLLEVFISREVDVAQAEAAYKVKVDSDKSHRVHVVERWTEKKYEVKVGDKTARYSDGQPMAGKNPFGIVPFEYLPRFRTGGYYGESQVKNLMGLQDEINARMADLGDAISEGVHRTKWIRNRPKGARGLRLDPYGFLDLGMPAGNHPPPEVGAIPPPDIPANSLELTNKLIELFRQIAHTPPVAYGMDEGSQRSALTLTFRMFPFIAMIERYRRNWAGGFKRISKKALRIMRVKGLHGITEQHERQLLQVSWAPAIPRDREQLVNEMVLLLNSALRSPETALQKLGDIPDEEIGPEIERIKEYLEWKASLGQEFGPPEAEEIAPMDQPEARVEM